MRLSSLLSFVLLLLAPSLRAAVLAIDYGAEFTKLSLVKPGVPLDVVLDRDSKRKIQSVVGWKRDDRVFGQEGKMAASRFPETHYPYIKPLIGATSLPTLPLYPNPPTLNADGSIIFTHPAQHPLPGAEGTETWTPTALLAHQIAYYRALAESASVVDGKKETITQAIVTVPAWWNQSRRKAYRDALELQGLTCLAMIGEGTAVALNYAMTRQFPDWNETTGVGEREYHLIYDSGAMSTTATVVAFWQTSVLPTPRAKTPINTTHIEVIGTGYEQVGGVLLDLNLKELLVEDFVKKSGKSGVRTDKRALVKLEKEANRVKHILSANQESNVNIESLYDDLDFRSRLSRQDLEDSLASTEAAYARPIPAALQSAGLSLDDLTSIILFGGNTRVPFVQQSIKTILGDVNAEKIAQNVNTDEAAVLGAAYYGAGLSRQFKMKSLDVLERSHEAFTLNGEDFFAKGFGLGEKKSITLPAKEGTELIFAQGSTPVLSVDILNLGSALANFTSPEPVINLTMRLDARGHVAVANVVLVSNVIEEEASSGGVAGALKGLFGKKDKEEAESDDTEDVTDEKKDKSKKKPEKIALRFKEHHLGVKPTSGEEKRKIMSRLTAIASAEAGKTAREEARNILEGYLYKLSNMLDPETDRKAIQEFSTPAERDVMSKLVAKTFDWLSEHAETATEKDLRGKRAELDKLEAPIVIRFNEMQTRGKAIEDFQQAMFAGRAFLEGAQKNNTEALELAKDATPEAPVAPPKYTEEELKLVQELLKDNEVWMDSRMGKQVKIDNDPTKDPEIYTKDLNDRGKRLQAAVMRLINKKAPKAPKPVKPTTSTSPEASSGTSGTAKVEDVPLANDSENDSSGSTTTTAESEKATTHDEL